MNKVEKELAKKRARTVEALGESAVSKLEQIGKIARELHSELFPEEFDCMMDSIADASDRKRGINPMSDEYTDKVNARRQSLGVAPLAANGMPADNSSWAFVVDQIHQRVVEL